MTSDMEGAFMECLTRIWLQCDNPRLAGAIRYGRRVLTAFDVHSNLEDTRVLSCLALDAYHRISGLLEEMAVGYQSAGPIRRHTAASVDRYAMPVMCHLATVAAIKR